MYCVVVLWGASFGASYSFSTLPASLRDSTVDKAPKYCPADSASSGHYTCLPPYIVASSNVRCDLERMVCYSPTVPDSKRKKEVHGAPESESQNRVLDTSKGGRLTIRHNFDDCLGDQSEAGSEKHGLAKGQNSLAWVWGSFAQQTSASPKSI